MTSKYTTKHKDSYTVDKEVLRQFKEVAKKNGINKSGWIQSKMEEYLREIENKK